VLVAPSLRPPAGVAAGFLLLALAIALSPSDVPAHDPSAFGGLFRTRNAGATWFVANPAGFLSGAIALAISPIDSNHLLLATDSGLLRSRNAGLDWKIEAPNVVIGPAFAAAFDADGQRALVSASSAIVRSDGEGWRTIRAPGRAAFLALLTLGGILARYFLAPRDVSSSLGKVKAS
jgi:photosystem II stability/assembly factor-like uncharacterized protein